MDVDVLIVGTGIAGLYTALNLSRDLKIAMITKSKVDECNSYLAQGGISTAINEKDKGFFIEDTLKAGSYKNDLQAVQVLAEESIDNIHRLLDMGIRFDMNGENFDYTIEGAHRVNRIVHCADETGKRVFQGLLKEVGKKRNITIYEDALLVDIIENNNVCYGGIIITKGDVININAKVTVFASGGIGGLFKSSTNQRTLKGNTLSIAIRHNIKLKDMNYIQFHPTALYEGEKEGRRFLISESLRGEGAYLLNNKGERFIDELLPRDVVARAIKMEEKKTNSPCVYLDITHKSKEFIINRFPLIYSQCKTKGLDITKDKIPVSPVQHYFMGGIQVGIDSRTSMKNLFACGETSCTGVHGANRLASNSLLEALVFSRRGAKYINKNIDKLTLRNFKSNITINEAQKLITKNNEIIRREFIKVREDIKDELVCS